MEMREAEARRVPLALMCRVLAVRAPRDRAQSGSVRPMSVTGAKRIVLVLTVLAVGACGGSVRSSPSGRSAAVSSHCRAAAVRVTAPPPWAADTPGVPTPPSPFALATGARIAAFLFVWPLRAHLSPGEADKVLWAADPRAGGNRGLQVVARYRGGRPSRRFFANSADTPPRVFRTRLRFARAGCWRLSLSSGALRATLDVQVRP
jgi:hypothetical protein